MMPRAKGAECDHRQLKTTIVADQALGVETIALRNEQDTLVRALVLRPAGKPKVALDGRKAALPAFVW
jgi:hypothetical protein